MRQVNNLSSALINDLYLIYKSETAQFNVLSSFIRNSASAQLKDELKEQADIKHRRIEKLENALAMLGLRYIHENKNGSMIIVPARNLKSQSGDEKMTVNTDKNSIHYESADYTTIYAYAKATGHNDVAEVIHQILLEEN